MSSPRSSLLSSPRPFAMLVSLLVTVVLAGCGVSDPPAEPTNDATGPRTSAAFPVSVEHEYGTTEIKAKPERIVTLGLSDQDLVLVLALGEVPVGAIDWFRERPYGSWPWTKDLWGTMPPEIVVEREDYDLERILALKPDLIPALHSGMTEDQYTELSKIAPTVGQPKVFLAFDPEVARARLEADPVYRGLAAVRENRVMFVPYAEPAIGAALSFNTVLSIPYAIDQLVPLLDKPAS